MTLATGFHYLNQDDASPIIYPAATFLDTGGVNAGMASQVKIVRLFGRGATDPATTAQKVIGWAQQGCLVQIANECNLALEGWTGQNSNDPALIERHAAWFLDVASRCGAVARTNLLYSPPSPGVPGWEAWLVQEECLTACHGYSAHVYGDLDLLKSTTWTYQQEGQHYGRPVYVTEMNFGAGRTVDLSRWATYDMPQYLNWCVEAAPLCKAVTVFAWDWRSPDTPQGTSVSFKDSVVVPELARWVAAHPYTEEETPVATCLGIDISNNNGYVDLAKVKAAGYEFVAIKASQDTEDGGFRDKFFAGNWTAAGEQEMARIAYHMTDPRYASPEQSVGLVEEMVNRVGGLRDDDAVAIDVELGQTDLVWLAQTLDLASRVFKHLVWKYSGDWYTSEEGLENAGIEQYPSWFVGSPGDTEQVGWRPVKMWQKTLPAGSVPGVAGDVDVNTFMGTVADLRAMGYKATGTQDTPSVPEAPPAPAETPFVAAPVTGDIDAAWAFSEGLAAAGQESQAVELQRILVSLKVHLGLQEA